MPRPSPRTPTPSSPEVVKPLSDVDEKPALARNARVARASCLEPGKESSAAKSSRKTDRKKYHVLARPDAEKLRRKIALARREPCSMPGERALHHALQCGQDLLVLLDKGTGKLHLQPYTCGKKFCPHCGVAWADALKTRLAPVAAKVQPDEVRHLVFTIPNASPGDLEERTRQLYAAFREWRNQGRRMRQGGWWLPVKGYCWKLEIDAKRGHGWHPHIHVLAHAPGGLRLGRASRAREAWASITATQGAPACLRNGVWITKCDSANYWRELAKYCQKPLQVAHMSPDQLAELASATRSLRFCHSAGTLKHESPDPKGSGMRYLWLGSASRMLQAWYDGATENEPVARALERYLEQHPEQSHNWHEVHHPTPSTENTNDDA